MLWNQEIKIFESFETSRTVLSCKDFRQQPHYMDVCPRSASTQYLFSEISCPIDHTNHMGSINKKQHLKLLRYSNWLKRTSHKAYCPEKFNWSLRRTFCPIKILTLIENLRLWVMFFAFAFDVTKNK